VRSMLGGPQRWAGISGITMESDFVEAPSQMLEEWIQSPQVLASFAIPADLVRRMKRASAFGRASYVGEQNGYTALSYEIYDAKPQDVDLDAIAMSGTVNHTLFTPLPDTRMYASFGHLAGYSSAYYTYMWDKVIAEDFVTQFDRKDLLAAGPAARYRPLVFE